MRLIQPMVYAMDTQAEFDELRRDRESWWYSTRRKLLREAATQRQHKARRLGFEGEIFQLEIRAPQLSTWI